jgi:hypothetical protein
MLRCNGEGADDTAIWMTDNRAEPGQGADTDPRSGGPLAATDGFQGMIVSQSKRGSGTTRTAGD